MYIDNEIVCIKRDRKYLDIYTFYPSYQIILIIELSSRTNKVGRYSEGVYYFNDQSTYFHSFSKGEEKKDEGRFYYRLGSDYKAYTTVENKNQIIIDFVSQIDIPILQHGGQKLFLNRGLVQAEEIGTGKGSIVYYNLSKGGDEAWKLKYSELTKSDKANLNSRILSCDDKLFFVITGNDKKGLFVLGAETGEVLMKFDGLCYEIFEDGEYIYTTQFENVLCRINTKTLELEEWDCNALVTENGFYGIHDHRCDVVGGEFCFTQSFGDNKAKLGVLDWKKKNWSTSMILNLRMDPLEVFG